MTKVLLLGAGEACKIIIKEIKKQNKMKIIGILDIDKKKHGMLLDNYYIFGDYKNIQEYVKNLEIDKIIITSTLFSSDEIKIIKEKVNNLNVKLLFLPEIEELNIEKELTKQLKNTLIPLSIPNLDVKPILDNLEECLKSGWVSTGGRFITEFEKKISNYVKVSDAVGVQSGTAGLHVALKVLGVEMGDEVIVPTLTFIAAVNPVTYLGANPIFIDCDDTLCIDPQKIEKFCQNECIVKNNNLYNKKTNAKIKAIIVVHVFGNIANMEKIMDIAHKYNLKVIEDSTEALGSYFITGKYKNKYAGTIGDIGVYSFNANKIITTGGGGMVVSNNQENLNKIRFLSVQAKTDPLYFIHDEVGYNYRMLNLQAALGTHQIDQLEKFIDTKIKNYYLYKKEIDKIAGLKLLKFEKNQRANYWFFSIIVNEEKYGITKDQLLEKLIDVNIQTRPIWGLIHEQKPYIKKETYMIEKANWFYDRILNIPCSSNLREEEVEFVIEKLKEFKQ